MENRGILIPTSLEDLGAATCKLVNFADRSPLEVLQKSSTVVASVTDTQTDRQTNIWTSRAAVAAKKKTKVYKVLCS